MMGNMRPGRVVHHLRPTRSKAYRLQAALFTAGGIIVVGTFGTAISDAANRSVSAQDQSSTADAQAKDAAGRAATNSGRLDVVETQISTLMDAMPGDVVTITVPGKDGAPDTTTSVIVVGNGPAPASSPKPSTAAAPSNSPTIVATPTPSILPTVVPTPTPSTVTIPAPISPRICVPGVACVG